MEEQRLISLEDIYKQYDGTTVLDHINLYIRKKEFVTLLGPSGCGKTTTLRIIGGFETADSGRVIFDGQDISGIPPYKRRVNTVFQKYALFPHLNVRDNIAFGLKLKKMSKDEIDRKVDYMLDLVNLKGYGKRGVDSLSGGQQQRIAIARALVNEPEVLLLDEPLGALDLKLRKEMQLELKAMQQRLGITFLYVTHDQEEALTMSDRVVVMNNGVIEQIGTPEDIYNEPVNAFVADFIGEANILNGIMIDDCRVRILGRELECVDKGFGKNTPVDVVIRPEDVIVCSPADGQLTGTVENITFKGVHYEISVRVGRCEILIHSTDSAVLGSEVGLRVIPFNIQIMNKLLPIESNTIETTVTYADETERSFEFELEGETITVPGKYIPEGKKVRIHMPFDALSITGEGEGHLKDVYIESVVYKGEHNEIILESDTRKWLMLSDTDEQVATYVPLWFDFSKASFEVIDSPDDGEGEQ